MPNYVVERYRSRSDPDSLRAMADRLAAGARSEASHGHIRYVHTIFVPEDETCFLLYEAASEDLVREAALRAALAFDRITAASLPLKV